jgi:hypothetical protein
MLGVRRFGWTNPLGAGLRTLALTLWNRFDLRSIPPAARVTFITSSELTLNRGSLWLADMSRTALPLVLRGAHIGRRI